MTVHSAPHAQFKEGLFKYIMKWLWALIMYEHRDIAHPGEVSRAASQAEDVLLER